MPTYIWSSDDSKTFHEDGRAVVRQASRRYQIDVRFEVSLSTMIGAEAEIVCQARFPVHSVFTVDQVADVLYRALLRNEDVV